MKQKTYIKKINVKLIGLGILCILVLIFALIRAVGFGSIGPTNTFTNGWYDYSFKYSTLTDVTQLVSNNDGLKISAPGFGECELYNPASTRLHTESISGNGGKVTFNGINWSHGTFTERFEGGSTDYAIWKTQSGFVILGRKSSTDYCENIVKAFRFEVVENDATKEAHRAKQAAKAYMASKGISAKIIAGVFRKDAYAGDSLTPTDTATVKLDSEPNTLLLKNLGGSWRVAENQ